MQAASTHSIWQKDIMYLKKVGPKRAEALWEACRIKTYEDLLHYYPRKYVDRSRVAKITELDGSEPSVSLVGKLTRLELVKTKRGKNRLAGTFTDGSGFLELTWFQGIKWIQQSLKVGEELAIFGKVNRYGGSLQMTHPEIDRLSQNSETRHTGQIVPFYASNEKLSRLGLDSRGFRTLMAQLLQEARNMIAETLNPQLMQEQGLVSRALALQAIHFPQNFGQLRQAKDRLKFEEFFFFELMLALRRMHARVQNQAPPFGQIGEHFHQFFEEHMPFELTGAQKRVLKEIRKDLAQPVQMNRLIQGDVGSGKTMVAFMSMLMAKDNGYQCALMAPTAILATQHYKKLTRMAEKVGMTTTLLVGGQKKKERTQVLESIASGETDIAIGTHALIEDTVQFEKLGLVIVDEQHKFGVKQRARLWSKANPFPHNMVMTATPIPRTLAMTLYGDVDVSVIDELPPGRQPIQTMVHRESKRLEVFGFIRREIEAGRQAYVVYPLVEESEKLDYLAAVKGFELLERHFQPFRVGIVHGKMKPDDKEIEMQRFVKNETQILVSTTVIEVGVDVPNATIMLIENAERFGLSQLHQLRGRVGRGGGKSYCVLMAGKKLSEEGKIRLKAMKESTDGFNLSEIDLKLRGPGDFLGTRQSGLPEFRVANLVDDQEILKRARDAAFDLAEKDPDLSAPEQAAIRRFYVQYARKNGKLGTVA